MIHHDPYETDNADSPILWTQNGMDNLGIDAVNMNDAAKIASGKSGTEYGATVSVYNATNTFMGDALKMKLGSLFNRVGSSGLEPADRTWDSIFQSGAMENGGRIIGHSQGAYITTQAIERNIDLTKNEPLEVDLILAGGAQSNQVADRVKTVRNLRNATDPIPLVASVGAPFTVDWVQGSFLGNVIGTIGNAFRGDLKIPEPPSNYQLIEQVPENSNIPLWGGTDTYDSHTDFVNGSGHSILQYMNGIQYSDDLEERIRQGKEVLK